ncbi:MAG: CAP domain-containing protein, partial [Pseudomonadota bacterium]
APSTSLNSSFGTLMNNTRLAANSGANTLVYDSDVGRAAQLHANDMYTRNYDSVQILGGGGDDIGDRVTDQGYSWEDIAQLIDRGENTTADQVAAFSDDVCDAPNGTCFARNNFAHFGVARAGSGADTRWVLVLTDPTGPNP